MMSFASTWGTTKAERLLAFPCDRHLDHSDAAYHRGVTIKVSPDVIFRDVIFRWLCQMRVAPYSYDWIDNLGHRSPQVLTPGLDDLAIGQRVMIGPLVEFERGRHLTVVDEVANAWRHGGDLSRLTKIGRWLPVASEAAGQVSRPRQ